MEKFEYDSKVLSIEAYGREIQLTKKTPELIERADAVLTAETGKDAARRMYDSIADMVGTGVRNEIFPSFEDADVNELDAFWLALCRIYKERTREISRVYGNKDESAS